MPAKEAAIRRERANPTEAGLIRLCRASTRPMHNKTFITHSSSNPAREICHDGERKILV